MACDAENDLPLMSNIDDILVKHYMFEFSCSFNEQQFDCVVVLFFESATSNESDKCECFVSNYTDTSKDCLSHSNDTLSKNKQFTVILDCHKILVHDIEEVILHISEEDIKYMGLNPKSLHPGCKLLFSSDKWSLKIWKDNSCKFCFPKAVRIYYTTTPEGQSLLWVKDQDRNPAVFTYGAWINNRSLFPCQEPPSAMATWEATVDVESPAIALMSGDKDANIHEETGRSKYYYFTKSVLPLSTLCLAVGHWQEHTISSKISYGPKCRIFSPPSLLNKSVQELFEYAPYCLAISEDVFDKYPFPRIDFLIVPPTFGSLGMASPNIVFLSQSLLTGDSSMSSRIAHEIAHGWFGLLIGALDWTEEWLSEGFATFVEDYFHVKTLNMSEKDGNDYIEIKTYIRLKTLLQEIANSDEELQLLHGRTSKEKVDGVSASVLKNGQNPIKAFMQVHYIKGYFLLKYLSEMVGFSSFMKFLKGYIEKYYGKLVTSKEFLMLYFSWFPNVNAQFSLEKIYEDWFYNPGILPEIKRMKLSSENILYANVLMETKKYIALNKAFLKQKHKKQKPDLNTAIELTPEAMILFLENILEEQKISSLTLSLLLECYDFSKANAEVQHRWFELVVKFKYKPMYKYLRKFLSDHLAMGVYLFGEMLFSKDKQLCDMAREVYFELKSEMEPNYVRTIQEMLKNSKN